MARFTVRIPDSRYEQLSRFAAEHNLSISACINLCLDRLLEPQPDTETKTLESELEKIKAIVASLSPVLLSLSAKISLMDARMNEVLDKTYE